MSILFIGPYDGLLCSIHPEMIAICCNGGSTCLIMMIVVMHTNSFGSIISIAGRVRAKSTPHLLVCNRKKRTIASEGTKAIWGYTIDRPKCWCAPSTAPVSPTLRRRDYSMLQHPFPSEDQGYCLVLESFVYLVLHHLFFIPAFFSHFCNLVCFLRQNARPEMLVGVGGAAVSDAKPTSLFGWLFNVESFKFADHAASVLTMDIFF